MKVYQPTWQEKFSLWAELGETQLTFELITYYMTCSLFGFITGFYMGSRIYFISF